MYREDGICYFVVLNRHRHEGRGEKYRLPKRLPRTDGGHFIDQHLVDVIYRSLGLYIYRGEVWTAVVEAETLSCLYQSQ